MTFFIENATTKKYFSSHNEAANFHRSFNSWKNLNIEIEKGGKDAITI